jgi:hypothetical protein
LVPGTNRYAEADVLVQGAQPAEPATSALRSRNVWTTSKTILDSIAAADGGTRTRAGSHQGDKSLSGREDIPWNRKPHWAVL